MTKTNKQIRRVAFFGDGEARKGEKHFEEAKKAAFLMAKKGLIVVNGGGPGVMLASTLGAKEGGGKVEIVILKKESVPGNFEGESRENVNLADKIYQAANYENRLNKLVEIADAFVIFKGGTGTIAEVGMVWSKAKFDFGKHEPLIFVGKEWQEIVPLIGEKLGLEKKEKAVYRIAEDAIEAEKELARVVS